MNFRNRIALALMLLAASVIVINFLVDVLYVVVDPRLKTSHG